MEENIKMAKKEKHKWNSAKKKSRLEKRAKTTGGTGPVVVSHEAESESDE